MDQNKDLLAEAAAANPDDFRKRSRRWSNAHSPDRGEELLERQRRRRTVRLFWSDNLQMGILNAELDTISFGQVRQALDKRTDLLRRDDSGGEVPPDDVRTGDQRRADALVELITGRRAHTLEPLPNRTGSGKEPTQLVVVADLGLLDGSRPDGECEIPGSGHLRGQRPRVVAGAQRLAAAVRDRGCVRCDAPAHQTELHHVRDWYDGGPTDIDNLVSLCGPHHRELGEHNRELVKTGKNPPPHRTAAPAAVSGAQTDQTPRPRRAPLTGDTPQPGDVKDGIEKPPGSGAWVAWGWLGAGPT